MNALQVKEYQIFQANNMYKEKAKFKTDFDEIEVSST
jgi:hypothetical protein